MVATRMMTRVARMTRRRTMTKGAQEWNLTNKIISKFSVEMRKLMKRR
jgi:hypothetical protein